VEGTAQGRAAGMTGASVKPEGLHAAGMTGASVKPVVLRLTWALQLNATIWHFFRRHSIGQRRARSEVTNMLSA
jgi:hypothetical protein